MARKPRANDLSFSKGPIRQDWPADKIERWPVSKLRSYPQNPMMHSDAQVEQIMASMREFGWTIPVLVDEHGEIIAGHGRLMAATKLGVSEVPVMIARGWSDAQKRAYRVVDNQLPRLGEWSPEMLKLELADLKLADYRLELLGFEDVDLVSFMAGSFGTADPEHSPDPPSHPVTRAGDIWLLGNHRLMCGNSTSESDVEKLMDGRRASLFSTDPPYAVGYSGGSHPATRGNRAKANRNKNWISYAEAGMGEGEVDDDARAEKFYRSYMKVAVDVAIGEKAPWYCWHASRRQAMVESIWNEFGAFVHQQIIWRKSRSVLTYAQYMWQHEPCLFGWIRGNRPEVRREKALTTVWEVPNSEIESNEHPTSKPTRLFIIPIDLHTGVGDVCYEPFSGSGTQIIAAEMLQRRCFAMEISNQFVDVGVVRWQKFVSKDATLCSTGQTFEEVSEERREKESRPKAAQRRRKNAESRATT